jgi:AcrR family transcriptional regulator
LHGYAPVRAADGAVLPGLSYPHKRDIWNIYEKSTGLIANYFVLCKISRMHVIDAQQDPRRERTRRSLIDGGRRVMARKGVEAATVLEIVREAGVSQPSFYNHFESKEALADAIAADFFQSDAVFKHRMFEQLDDPAEAIAVNARHTLRVAIRDPIVAWVMVRGGAGRNLLHSSNSDELAKMLTVGIHSGRFKKMNPRVAALVIRGAAFPLLQDILQGTAPADIERQFVVLVLRMLGLSPNEASDVASRPEPAFDGRTH